MSKTYAEKITDWIIEHDDRMSFTLIYVGTAVCLSIFMNLFWVAMLMLGHLSLEICRHRVLAHRYPVLQAVWDVKLDIALVLFALVIALYSEMVFGLLGLGQAARASRAVTGVKLLTRITILERAVKVFFLTVDDMSRITHLLIKSIRNRKAVRLDTELHLMEHEEHIPDGKIAFGDIFALGFGALCIGLIIASAFILPDGIADTAAIILNELNPFPQR